VLFRSRIYLRARTCLAPRRSLTASPRTDKNAPRARACRFHAALDGVEWTLYNRTATFDWIAQQMDVRAPASRASMDGAASASARRASMDAAGRMSTDGAGRMSMDGLRAVFSKVSGAEDPVGQHAAALPPPRLAR
jgi:hypothetical protein